MKSSRDQSKVETALNNLSQVAKSDQNTMPAIIECVEALATTGEICDVLREIFGIQKEMVVF
jgi:methylmalonyl-CoA mutase N-terminal domain/subunit